MSTPSTPSTLPSDHKVYDITFVGGGPTGLFGAYYAGLRHMSTKIIDSLDQLGGQLSALYPEKYIYDVAGFPKVTAKDLVHNLVNQAMQYSPHIALGQVVRTLECNEALDCYVLSTDQQVHYTKTIVLSAGVGSFSPKKLPLKNIEHLEGHGIHYFVTTKSTFAHKHVLIVGGGDSAVDWALNLQGTAQHITLIHRRNQFRAHEDSVSQLMQGKADVLTFWEIKDLLLTETKALRGVLLINNQSKEEREMDVDAILVQVGFVSTLGPLHHFGVKIVHGGIEVNQHMETQLPGVFAAGDVAHFDGKLKLIVTGFGEAATAVNHAKMRIDPKAKLFPGHSSETATHQPVLTTIPSPHAKPGI